jgi:hypothetical protein
VQSTTSLYIGFEVYCFHTWQTYFSPPVSDFTAVHIICGLYVSAHFTRRVTRPHFVHYYAIPLYIHWVACFSMASDRGVFHTKIKQDAKYSNFCRWGKLNTHTKARKVFFQLWNKGTAYFAWNQKGDPNHAEWKKNSSCGGQTLKNLDHTSKFFGTFLLASPTKAPILHLDSIYSIVA